MKVLLAAAQVRCFSTRLTYSLDTAIASYLLNGELWKRKDFNLPWVNRGKKNAPANDSELNKALKAYKWSSFHTHHGNPCCIRLVVPPTATLELARAPQVSTVALCGTFLDVIDWVTHSELMYTWKFSPTW
jgi:hypothetical protein